MSSTWFTFDHDFARKTWSHSRTVVPVQLMSLDLSVEDWSKFWDEAQETAERTKIRKDLLEVKIKSLTKKFAVNKAYEVTDMEKKEMDILQNEMNADWKKLAMSGESVFAQAQVQPSSKSRKIEHIDTDKKTTLFKITSTEYFGLQIQIFNQNYEKYTGKKVLFYYDENRQTWSLPRSPIPKELMDLGVTTKDWFEFYDYASGVKERAVKRRKENEKHNRTIRVLNNIVRGNTYESLSSQVNNNSPPAVRIKKLEQVKKENNQNTMKGWIVLQLKVKNTWMGTKGVYVTPLLRGQHNECYGLALHTDPDYKPSEQDQKNEKFLQQQLEKQKQEQEEKKKQEERAKKAAAAAAAAPKPKVEKVQSLGAAKFGFGAFMAGGEDGEAGDHNLYFIDDGDKEQWEADKRNAKETIAAANVASPAAFFMSGMGGDGGIYRNDEEDLEEVKGQAKSEHDDAKPIAEESAVPPASMFLGQIDAKKSDEDEGSEKKDSSNPFDDDDVKENKQDENTTTKSEGAKLKDDKLASDATEPAQIIVQ